jgi:Astacin (Peptidase family M12A)
MTKSEKQLRDALARIADVASQAVGGMTTNGSNETVDEPKAGETEFDPNAGCSIKQLPTRLIAKAAQTAITINPVNAPAMGAMANLENADVLTPEFLTLLVSKYWGPTPRRLTVSFMEATSLALKNKILSHMNAWAARECISFVLTNGTGQVRISRGGGGFYSYLGTDILHIPANKQTMNLQGFTLATPDSEYRRVVRHETGHTLGFPHEHMRQELVNRIDPQKAYAYFLQTQGWNKATVDAQVLTPLNQASIFGTPADQTSIMCYQLPGSITKNGLPITGGIDINATDYAFAGQIYPIPGHSPAAPDADTNEDWDASEDVDNQTLETAIRATIMQHNGPSDRETENAQVGAESYN